MQRTHNKICIAAALFCSIFCALPGRGAQAAPAEAPSEASLTAARALGEEGLKLFDAGNYSQALERFEKADAVLHVPTINLYAARCLEKLGRLADALRRYGEVTRAELSGTSPPAFKQAQIDAEKEMSALAPRVPSLMIVLEGDPAEVSVTIDGQPVDLTLLNEKNLLNPGPHHIEAKRGDKKVEHDIELAEGESKTTVLKLPPRPKAEPALTHFMDPELAKTLGFVGLGIGAAGLAAWGITGGLAFSQQDDLKKIGCENGRCPPGSSPGTYTPLRIASAVSFYTGLAATAAGLVLLITLPSKESSSQSNQNALQLWISPQQAGLSGHF